MNIKIKSDCTDIDWNLVVEILKAVGMGYHEPEIHSKAFKNSQVVVFIFDDDKLIGFGRAISDGAYQAAIYDCAILPDYQGHKLGALIIDSILEKLKGYNILLYASPGKEGFYIKQGFSNMKTGMARFVNENKMRAKGFIE
ncbi:GNAT family N-acetyltransferase [Maridesulfovibrio bastinii]|uniref:GNAT family N-acetyltransferase n=1 Tax=Maridesulfovibrio bastinii TaxID=47157 RepID=UPI0004027451|nr:GNAT family N-acetyltransferase [Maridesulfovibrio bastinii]